MLPRRLGGPQSNLPPAVKRAPIDASHATVIGGRRPCSTERSVRGADVLVRRQEKDVCPNRFSGTDKEHTARQEGRTATRERMADRAGWEGACGSNRRRRRSAVYR